MVNQDPQPEVYQTTHTFDYTVGDIPANTTRAVDVFTYQANNEEFLQLLSMHLQFFVKILRLWHLLHQSLFCSNNRSKLKYPMLLHWPLLLIMASGLSR